MLPSFSLSWQFAQFHVHVLAAARRARSFSGSPRQTRVVKPRPEGKGWVRRGVTATDLLLGSLSNFFCQILIHSHSTWMRGAFVRFYTKLGFFVQETEHQSDVKSK